MDHRSEREALVAYARRLNEDGLSIGTSGNLSIRVEDRVLITPSAVGYDVLTAEQICAVGLDGGSLDATTKPSTELPMHLAVYRRTAASAITHAHPVFATAVSTLVSELPPVHYMIADLGGPVRVARYLTPGTPELADEVSACLEGRSGVLLENHGALTIGSSLAQAYDRMQLLEWLSTVYHRATCAGVPRVLTEDELDAFARRLAEYGRRD